MTLEVRIPNHAAGGFAFGNTDQDAAHAMGDAVAAEWTGEVPPDGALLELELTLDETHELIRGIKERFPTTTGTTLKKAAMTQPAPTYH